MFLTPSLSGEKNEALDSPSSSLSSAGAEAAVVNPHKV